MSPWQAKFMDEIIPIFDDIYKNLSLVCKLHTSHVTESMALLIVIIAQRISLVQIWISYHFLKLRYYFPCSLYPCMLTIVAKRCTFKNLFRSCLPSYVVVLPCNFTEGNILYCMFCIFSFASKFWNTKVDITRMYLNASLEWL